MLSRYIRSWGGYKLHIGSNLPPKDNLRKEGKSSAPKVSFIWKFHCMTLWYHRHNPTLPHTFRNSVPSGLRQGGGKSGSGASRHSLISWSSFPSSSSFWISSHPPIRWSLKKISGTLVLPGCMHVQERGPAWVSTSVSMCIQLPQWSATVSLLCDPLLVYCEAARACCCLWCHYRICLPSSF